MGVCQSGSGGRAVAGGGMAVQGRPMVADGGMVEWEAGSVEILPLARLVQLQPAVLVPTVHGGAAVEEAAHLTNVSPSGQRAKPIAESQ